MYEQSYCCKNGKVNIVLLNQFDHLLDNQTIKKLSKKHIVLLFLQLIFHLFIIFYDSTHSSVF